MPVDTLVERMHQTAVRIALNNIRKENRLPCWADFHSTALMSTLDSHKESLVKLVRIQATFNQSALLPIGGGRHNKLAALGQGKNGSAQRRNKKMLAMMLDQGDRNNDTNNPTTGGSIVKKNLFWWDLYNRIQVVEPQSILQLRWNIFILLCMVYYIIAVPLRYVHR